MSITTGITTGLQLARWIRFLYSKHGLCQSFYILILPPANGVCEGYVFTLVCHSVHGGGVCLSACWDTQPPSRHPPGADTPLLRSACWEICATNGRRASYLNAYLFLLQLRYNLPGGQVGLDCRLRLRRQQNRCHRVRIIFCVSFSIFWWIFSFKIFGGHLSFLWGH